MAVDHRAELLAKSAGGEVHGVGGDTVEGEEGVNGGEEGVHVGDEDVHVGDEDVHVGEYNQGVERVEHAVDLEEEAKDMDPVDDGLASCDFKGGDIIMGEVAMPGEYL